MISTIVPTWAAGKGRPPQSFFEDLCSARSARKEGTVIPLSFAEQSRQNHPDVG